MAHTTAGTVEGFKACMQARHFAGDYETVDLSHDSVLVNACRRHLDWSQQRARGHGAHHDGFYT